MIITLTIYHSILISFPIEEEVEECQLLWLGVKLDCDAENESLESLILSIKASTVCVESVASRLIITLHTLTVICIMHLA